jgi:hypothetical protein
VACCVRESLATAWCWRDDWTWRYINSLFAFLRAGESILTRELQLEAQAERRAYSEWVREIQDAGGYNSDSS